MATAILCRCGVSFSAPLSKPGKFCSVSCYRDAQRSGEYKTGHGPNFPAVPCDQCGVVVRRLPSICRDGTKSDKMFCCRACYDTFRENQCSIREDDCKGCGIKFLQGSTKWRSYCTDSCWKLQKKAKPSTCVNCKCIFTAIYLQPKTGKYISKNGIKTCSANCHNQWIRNNPERKRKIGEAFKGVLHPNWQGGKSLLNDISRRGPNWQKQREKAIKRDECCVDCGLSQNQSIEKFGRGLDVDHVVPFHNFLDYKKANSLSNLECRCASCHRRAEAKRGMVQMVLPMQDSVKRMHKGYVRGERVNTAKLKQHQVIDIRRRSASGESRVEIAKLFAITLSNACDVINGKTWRYLLPVPFTN